MKIKEVFPSPWVEIWEKKGFVQPSLIQEKSFACLKDGENVLGISPTGSGKTIAYALPLLLTVKRGEGNQLLILTPSQELSTQVAEVIREWATPIGLKTLNLTGGGNVKHQIEKLKQRPEVLIGTPGRVYELVKNKKVKLMQVHTIVLDEFDHLLGTEEASFSERLIRHVPKDFQLVFFSATGEKADVEVERLAGENVVKIDVTQEDDSKGVVHYYSLVTSKRKKIEVLRGLSFVEGMRAFVFFNTLQDLGNAEEKLLFDGIQVASLASDQNKLLRKAALEKFKSGDINLLLTTDVLARGLDLENIPFVINFEPPLTTESFTHRVGRVGRMGNDGNVLTLVETMGNKDLKRREKSLNVKSQEVFLWGGSLVSEIPKQVEQPKKKKKKKKKRK